jgi:excisionase family DNA binding protein
MQIQPHTPQFISRKEAAESLGISLPTISRHLTKGLIPHIKLGGRVLIPVEFIHRASDAAFSVEGD